MATSRDAPNPLRPYYIPPSIGLPPELPAAAASSANTTTSASRTSKPSLGSQARDILSDLDYDAYFPDSPPSVAEHAKRLLDQALWNYTSVLLAQPFEVAKTLLQVHQVPSNGLAPPVLLGHAHRHRTHDALRSRPSSFASGKFEDYPPSDESEEDDDEDDDGAGYFTSAAPRHGRVDRSRSPTKRRRHAPSRSRDSTPTQAPPPAARRLELRKVDSLLEVIAQLWQKESAWGVWKATNVTFVYNFALKTTESWTRSMLSALLNVPDPGLIAQGRGGGGLDIVDSSSPIMSLGVAVAATALAALLLAPLDLIRTRLIVTPTSAPPRTIYPSLSLLPSFSIAPTLLPATLLHATLPTFISSSTPLFLRTTFSIDPVVTPTAYSISTFLSSTAELFVRLPLETVLRRGQVAVLQEHENERLAAEYRHHPASTQSTKAPVYGMENEDPAMRCFKTIVEPGPYKGVLGTMWFIVREEGVQVVGPGGAKAGNPQAQGGPATFSSRTRARKGQGVHGLWRGWRVGFWGLVGVWGASALGGGGGEF